MFSFSIVVMMMMFQQPSLGSSYGNRRIFIVRVGPGLNDGRITLGTGAQMSKSNFTFTTAISISFILPCSLFFLMMMKLKNGFMLFFKSLNPAFCSKRCKLVDLGQWFSEEHKISEPLRPEHFAQFEELPPGKNPDAPET